MTKSRKDRESFIVSYISAEERRHVSVLSPEFVDAYIEYTGANYLVMMWGANKCRLLSSDLSRMYKNNILKRFATGIRGGEGFPRWVYIYSLEEAGE